MSGLKYSRIKRKILAHPKLVRSLFLIGLALLLIVGFCLLLRLVFFLKVPEYFHLASKFITAPTSQLAQDSGRTNILIVGKAGGDYSGPELTDTILVASLSLTAPRVVIVSIPRDLWIPEARAKINSAYYYGKMPLAKSLTSKVVGIPIHYGVLIDFSGFMKIIDILGGVDVNVETGFTDNLYPIAGRENDLCDGDKTYACRYESITFSPGIQLMDGATALKFVRSRRAEGTEGTDIAREARQQKIIEAVKNKLLDYRTFINPRKDLAIYRAVKDAVTTDIDGATGAILARRFFDSRDSIKNYLIPEDLLVNPPASRTYDNQYVFIPKEGNGKWEEIAKWVESIL